MTVFAVGTTAASAPVAAQTPAGGHESPRASPYGLARTRPGEPSWAPLLRLRAAAATFDRDTLDAQARMAPERQAWLQLLAQAEATFGNPAAALRAWDRLGRATVADLPAVRRRFASARRVSLLDTLMVVADTARVIMVNERHHAAADRLLTLQLLATLREKGFRYFAAEAFARDTMAADSAAPAVIAGADDGSYTSEPVFAEVVREARRLGYVLVPYEAHGRQFDEPDSLSPQQRRDLAQAQNLYAATLARDSRAKVLVHAGFAHVRERASGSWSPMAMYFRQLSGVDPVTIDQTSATERSTPQFGHPVHRALGGAMPARATVFLDSTGAPMDAAAQQVDFVVFRGATGSGASSATVDGRPAWLALDGRRTPIPVDVPECAERHCIVTAHLASDADTATVLDRTEADHRRTITLFLPRGPVRITVSDMSGTGLRRWTVSR